MKATTISIGAAFALALGSAFAALPASAGSFPGGNGKIAFARDTGTPAIWIMNADGTHAKRIAASGTDAPAPSWSADGSKLAFVGSPGGGSEIVVSDARGKHVKRLTKNKVTDGGPSWSPDGTQIAFTHFDDNGPDIWVMDADGKHQVDLTSTPDIDEDQPAWSPDGKTIAFTSQATGPGIHPVEIAAISADGTGRRTLVPNAAAGNPVWSPDGTKLAYDDTVDDHNPAIYVVNADGSNPVAITDGSTPVFAPWWSPDGTKILFTTNNQSSFAASQIWVMNADGSGQKQLTNVDGAIDRHPSWQPVVKLSR